MARTAIAFQAALSVLLIAGALAFVRSLQQATTLPLGYEPARVVIFGWHSAGLEWSRVRVHDLHEAARERLTSLPEGEAAAVATTQPLASAFIGEVRLPDRPTLSGDTLSFLFKSITPDYFRAVGSRLKAGRYFSERDVAGGQPVAIVSESMARQLWPRENPLGRCIVHVRDRTPACREVVGVVEDVRYRHPLEQPEPMYFVPLAQEQRVALRALFVRTRTGSKEEITRVRDVLQTLEPDLPRVMVTPLPSRIEPYVRPWRLGTVIVSGFSGLAIVLIAIGLLGVVAHDLAQRKEELSVRLALGAAPQRIARMVVGETSTLIAAGAAAGSAMTYVVAPLIRPLLFNADLAAPIFLASGTGLLLLLGAVSALLPALQVLRAEPFTVLRGNETAG